MRKFFDGKTILISAISVVIAISTLISVNVFESSGPATGAANLLTRPLMALTANIARTFESIYGNIYRYEQVVRDLERAHLLNQQLRDMYAEAAQLEYENRLFRAMLDIRPRLPDPELEFARILGPGSANWASTFTIEIGSVNADIRVGNSVITAYGMLIGRVSDVGFTTSTVVSVLDTTFSARVLIGETGQTATARGDFSLMNSGLLMLDHIADDIPVVPGDTIVTTDDGGTFPEGLVIGQVQEVHTHATGVGRFAIIRPTLPINSISYCFVIIDFQQSYA